MISAAFPRRALLASACLALACSSEDERSTGGGPGGPGGSGSTASNGASATTGGPGSGGAAASTGATGGGGASTGGTGGTGGSTGRCPASQLVGWAAESGHGVVTTTGGGNVAPVTATTAAELQQYASDPQPMLIRIAGTIAVPRLELASNKTLEGADASATLQGGIRIRGDGPDPAEMISNVIVRNLHVDAATADNDGDGIQVHYANHVWVDHVEVWDAADGNFDIVHGSDYVTVSFTKFRYTDMPPDPAHRFSDLIGHSDNNAAEDDGRLRITFHHDWWAENIVERMPRVRFGQVHLFDNYYSAAGNNYAIGGGLQAKLVVENNYFDGVNDPHIFYGGEPTAQIVASGNMYVGVSDTTGKDTGQGTAFTPPYAVTMDPADAALKDLVTQCAGPQ